jgi:hypothetical protein
LPGGGSQRIRVLAKPTLQYFLLSNSSRTGRGHQGAIFDILKHLAALHHEDHLAHIRDVFQRAAGRSDDIGLHPWRDATDLVLHAQRLGSRVLGRHKGRNRLLTAISHTVDEFLEVAPVCARSTVRSEDDLHLLRQRSFERVDPDRDTLLHVIESSFIKVSDSQIARLVLDVVMQQETEVRIKIRAVFQHQIEHLVSKPISVLDRGAASKNRGPGALRPLRMDHRPLAQCPSFPAAGLKLCIRKRLSSPFPNALGGEDFDHVRPVCNELADLAPDVIRSAI